MKSTAGKIEWGAHKKGASGLKAPKSKFKKKLIRSYVKRFTVFGFQSKVAPKSSYDQNNRISENKITFKMSYVKFKNEDAWTLGIK